MTQEEKFKAARKAQNTEDLIAYYTNELGRYDLTAISRRYYNDMLEAFMLEKQGDISKKREVNDFWNEIDTQRDVHNNKIDFLHETVSYLRELVIEVSNPETSLMTKYNIVRTVNNKNFLSEIRSRIKSRIRDEERAIEKAIAKKDAEYKKQIKEAQSRNS